MKLIKILTLAFILALTSQAKELQGIPFSTKAECEQACITMLTKTASSSFSELLKHFADGDEEALEKIKKTKIVTRIDELRTESGKFESVELVGSATSGSYFQKNGYLVKYENTIVFVEFIIIKTGDRYELQYRTAKANPFMPNFIGSIPDYCWKIKKDS